MKGQNLHQPQRAQKRTKGSFTRREFLQTSATLLAASSLPVLTHAFPAGSDKIRVGLIGCGGRGTGAAHDCVNAAEGVEIYALGDLFKDRLDACRENLQPLGEKVNLTDDRCFVGFEAYKQVIESGVDLVILATPPAFRPLHFKAAVEAGKHVFMEKPVAVCPTGVRMVIETSDLAAQKGLAVVAGTQYRHHAGYIETIKRIHEGVIGRVVAAYAYYLTGGLWSYPRQPGWSDVEWQIRNWIYFTWLSGDHIVEQFIHNLDIMNWVLRSHPLKALALGGRQVRTDPAYGNVYDHFAVEYEYPEGVKIIALCRQMEQCTTRITNEVIGTKGTARLEQFTTFWIKGETNWQFEGSVNPYVQEHADLIESIRSGKPLNEGRQVAESTLTAILGRLSAYTGLEVSWEQALNSKLNLVPKKMEFGSLPVEPVAVPGKTALI